MSESEIKRNREGDYIVVETPKNQKESFQASKTSTGYFKESVRKTTCSARHIP